MEKLEFSLQDLGRLAKHLTKQGRPVLVPIQAWVVDHASSVEQAHYTMVAIMEGYREDQE